MIDVYKKVKAYYGDYCRDYYKAYYGDCCRDCCWVKILFINLTCCTSYLGTIGVREDILTLKLNGVKNL